MADGLTVIHLVQQRRQTILPHSSSIGLSTVSKQTVHRIECGLGRGLLLGKNDAGAAAVSLDTRSLSVLGAGRPNLPCLPPAIPPPA